MSTSVRTYGQWTRPRSSGLMGLGSIGTAALLGGLCVGIFTVMLLGLVAGLIVFAGVGILLLLVSTKDRHGRSPIERAGERLGFRRANRRRETVYRSGPEAGGQGWGAASLPGVLAQTKLREITANDGRPCAVIEWPRTKQVTVVLGAEPDGAALVDDEQIDSWVSGWAECLTDLGDEPGLAALSVTVETAPETGDRLAQEVASRRDEAAPAFALEVLDEAVETLPAGSSHTAVYIAVTFDTTLRVGGRRRDIEEIGRDLATRLPGLCAQLVGSGAGAATPLTAQELCEVVRVAYNPGAAGPLAQLHREGNPPTMLWPQAGPKAAEASWEAYRHDDGISVTWSMSEAPRGLVQSSILTRLLSPHQDIDRKRVTLLYQPVDAARAAALVERDLRTAEFLMTTSDRPTARVVQAHRAATATATEEASGAGLVEFGMFVTATVTDPTRLPDAIAAVENVGATARIRLRPAYGRQDAAFAACLPLGLIPRRHLSTPDLGERL